MQWGKELESVSTVFNTKLYGMLIFWSTKGSQCVEHADEALKLVQKGLKLTIWNMQTKVH